MGTTRDSLRTAPYRYDLDGLRGIAIAFVVLFHVFVGRVSGGVDVFLLLSGYFFLGSQLRYAARPDASLNMWWPIWRTLRRLLPGLVLVLATTAVGIVIFAPELRNLNVARQLTASLLYFQNWELADQGADYNVASNTVSPLQHLWSMSVQGQFYLFAILVATIISFVLRGQRRRRVGVSEAAELAGPLLLALTVFSFGYAIVMHFINQPLNYYSTWTRFWELTLGGLLVLYGTRLSLAGWVKEIFTIVGLFMVLTTGFFFDGATQFPGPATLYPIIGAVLVILGGGKVAGLLGSKVMRWLGDIAYPLYLWHWPLLILASVALEVETPGPVLGVLVVLASLLLADLTHRFVDKPLAQHAKRPPREEKRAQVAWQQLHATGPARARALGGVVVAVAMAALLSLQPALQLRVNAVDGEFLDPRIYPGAAALAGAPVPEAKFKPDPTVLGQLLPPSWLQGCMSTFEDSPDILPADREQERDPEACRFGNIGSDTVVYLTGGSHAEQWITPLNQLGQEHDFEVVPLVRQSCPNFAADLDGLFLPECEEFNQNVLARIAEDRPDVVVSTSTRPFVEQASVLEEVPTSYTTFWEFLADEQIPFIGLRDNPWSIFEDGTERNIPLCVYETGDVLGCGVPRGDVYLAEDPAAPYLDPQPEMKAVDTSDWFCPDQNCPAVIGNIHVYRDANHMSNAYALTLAPFLWEEIKEFFPAPVPAQ
ncbi:O-acetyltransferase OatA [Corynebacterium occultum]|uniref:O-acetyltransferase OatA n=1 Tax=Corynebacterium occultum TaxID=2675219 RepID=A0A6B8W5F8_9CORY|nr:acyltransferase family protein [Corynebacterium occultum]QGU06565.1 O-acetyltransferase OatA [Corynebacterium occultum]